MIDRRDLIFGTGLLVAAGGAAALTPRRRVEYLGGRKLDAIVPKQIGGWVNTPSTSFVLPKTPGSLADKLYSDTISRLYVSPDDVAVMLVMAYGNVQSDLLQLHRPETCYTAIGFQISSSTRTELGVVPQVDVPVRELTANNENRVEPIVYWTRIGDALPTDGGEQRRVKLRQQMAGIIADGILVRMSTIAPPEPAAFAALEAFGRAMILAVAPADRAVLIGPTLSNGLRSAGV